VWQVFAVKFIGNCTAADGDVKKMQRNFCTASLLKKIE
jgi:hypothetical protein